ncbi:hypothetical protein GBA52_002610 [Prunus armeniaca]|nr:hypothetical protein GBA52_002610 [Prunus armeniaca]
MEIGWASKCGHKQKQASIGSCASKAKKKKARDDNINDGETAVKEKEIEEFFAILSRIHRAVRYFKNADGSGHEFTHGRYRLRAVLASNEEVNDTKMEPKMDAGVEEENLSFDLNANPDSKCDPST